MEATMTRQTGRRATQKAAPAVQREARSKQKATTLTPGDARRLALLAEREDRTEAYLVNRAVIAMLDAAGIVDDGVRTE